MRKILLFLTIGCCMLFFAIPTFAQQHTPKWYYIQVTPAESKIHIERGDDISSKPSYYWVLDNDGSRLKRSGDYLSVVNYMSEKGWEFVCVTTTA